MSDEQARRDALERWIAGQLPACSIDELRVIAVRVERMAKARADYGALNLSQDDRDFVREAAEENVDRAFYRDCAYIKRQDEAREQLQAGTAVELGGLGCDCWMVPIRHLEITGHLARCPAAHRGHR